MPVIDALAAQSAWLVGVLSLTRCGSEALEPLAHVSGIDPQGTADALERKQRASVRARDPPVHLASVMTRLRTARVQTPPERDEGLFEHGQHQAVSRTGCQVLRLVGLEIMNGGGPHVRHGPASPARPSWWRQERSSPSATHGCGGGLTTCRDTESLTAKRSFQVAESLAPGVVRLFVPNAQRLRKP